MAHSKALFRYETLKRLIASFLVVCLTLSCVDITSFFGTHSVYAESTLNRNQTPNPIGSTLVATDSNSASNVTTSHPTTAPTAAPSTTEGELTDGVLLNDLGQEEVANLRSYSGFYQRPPSSELREAGDFLVQDTANGLVIWGFKVGFVTDNLTIPDELMHNGVNTHVVEIGEGAFALEQLVTLHLGQNLKKIGMNAFAGNNLTTLTIPDGLEEIGKEAFRDNAITDLDLKHVLHVEDGAFFNNRLTSLNLGDRLIHIGADAFRNNSIFEVDLPDTMQDIGHGAFSFNGKYVKINTDMNPLPAGIPGKDMVSGGHGHVVRPINIIISYKDQANQSKIKIDTVLESDLTSENIFVLGVPQTFTIPHIPGYVPVETGTEIVFTPDQDNFQLNIYYNQLSTGLVLEKDPTKEPMLAPFDASASTDDVKQALLNLIKAYDNADPDMKDQVTLAPDSILESIKNAVEGNTFEVEYILTSNSGEQRRIKMKVYIGTNLLNFPLDNGWVLGDFVYGGQSGEYANTDRNAVHGFSAQGLAKLNAGNKDVVLPHFNPYHKTPITKVFYGNVAAAGGSIFGQKEYNTVRDFEDSITTIGYYGFHDSKINSAQFLNLTRVESNAFQNNDRMTTFDAPKLEFIGSYAFVRNRVLENMDLANVKEIQRHAFEGSGIKKAIMPNLERLDIGAFWVSQIGADPNYPQGFYIPLLSELPDHTFNRTQLTYVDRNQQMPNVTKIGANAFSQSKIKTADITGVTDVGADGFKEQNNPEKLASLIAPDLVNIGRMGFYHNGLTNLNLPEVKNMADFAFAYNRSLTGLSAPKLETIGEQGFIEAKLTKLTLPALKKAGKLAFSKNYIKEAFLDNAEELGVDIFYSDYWPNQRNNVNAQNPGVAALDYFIPVYTNNLNLLSRENYIVNPGIPSTDPWDEGDFTWDATDLAKVTGLTSQGKNKLIAKEYRLVIPPRATSVADYAFPRTQIRTVEAPNVTHVGENSFAYNPLNIVTMPALTTIGARAFGNNTSPNNKLGSFDFSRITRIDNDAFNGAGLIGNLSLPLVTELGNSAFASNQLTYVDAPLIEKIGVYTFYGNRITDGRFPLVTRVENSGMMSNQFQGINGTNFPKLEFIDSRGFTSNPLKQLEFVNPTQIHNSQSMHINEFDTPLVWQIPPTVTSTSTAATAFTQDMFAYTYSSSAQGHVAYAKPNIIMLTSPPNADGTLNRGAARGITEVIQNSRYVYNGAWVNNVPMRSVVVDPSTVKVNFRVDQTNEPFDGQAGRPLKADYREYIYEELEPRIMATGAWQTARTFVAPVIPGYVLSRSVDASNVSTPNKDKVAVPFEQQGHRTDREITFYYKKVEIENNPNIVLNYKIKKPNTPANQPPVYVTEQNYLAGRTNPDMLTFFDLDVLNGANITLQNPKIRIEVDSPFIDFSKTLVAEDASSLTLFNAGNWSAYPGGVTIDVKDNLQIATINNVGVRFVFDDNTPNLARATARVILSDVVGGVEKIIAQSNPVLMTREYTEANLYVREDHTIPGMSSDSSVNGARNLGLMTGTDLQGGARIVENPAPTSFWFSTSGYSYNKTTGFDMVVEIGDYTAIDPVTNQEITRTPVFDPALNPGWSKDVDGKFHYKMEYPAPRFALEQDWKRIYFSFPGMKENAPVTVKSNLTVHHVDDPMTQDPAVTNSLRGDLGYGDSLTVFPVNVGTGILFTGTDFDAQKFPSPTTYTINGTNRTSPRGYQNNSYIYDYIDDRSMEIPYLLSVGSTNEMYDFRDIQVFDYKKDSRLKFKRLEFTQTAAQADARVLVGGYLLAGANVNPAADTLVMEQEVGVDHFNKVFFPDNIDYIRIKVIDSENTPLRKNLLFKVITELKDPAQNLLPADGILENASMTSAKIYKKGTEELALSFAKPNDPKYANLDGNVILEREARVLVYEYKMNVALDKSLTYPIHAGSYPIYPAYGAGDVLGGQAGAYHLSLNTSMGGNATDRGANVLENFEIIDVFPEGMELKASDIVLYDKFVNSGGRFEVIGEYPVTINGVTTNQRAIRFYAPRLDLYQYGNNKYVIATIKTKFLGDTDYQKITNTAYATWDPKTGVEAQNVAMSGNQLLAPNGSTGTKIWSTDSESIKVTVASALSGNLKIRNKRDNLWTTSTKTRSDEAFDYRMSIRNLDIDTSRSYSNFEIVNILPGVNDNQQSKTGLRGSQFDENLDLSRLNEFKFYIVKQDNSIVSISNANYQIGYHNSATPTANLLDGINITQYNDQTTWANAPDATTKAFRVKFDQHVTLAYGDELVVEVPMRAPNLPLLSDNRYDKKGVDSFSFRFTMDGATPLSFREVNNVENIMEAPRGSITFKKYAKEGTLTPITSATPLAGAAFSITGAGITQAAYSDNNGVVTFEGLDIRHNYNIQEISAPNGYRKSNETFTVIGMQTMNTAPNHHYTIPDDNTTNGIKTKMLNVKPITGSITIRKQSVDPAILLPNVSFTVKGMDVTNNHINQEVTTGQDGTITVENLPEGRYTITEILSSQVNRYTDVGTENVNITPTTTQHTVNITNQIVQVLLKKVITNDVNDLDPNNWDRVNDFGKTRVAGYKFKVTDANGVSVYTDNTNAQGEVIIRNLRANMVYTVTEEATQSALDHVLYRHNTNSYQFKVTPQGYVVNARNNQRFRQQSMNFPNMEKEIQGKIILKKHEEGNTTPIVGAEFKLEKIAFAADGSIASSTLEVASRRTEMVGANAEVHFDNLAPGSYRITEIQPALGYYFGQVPPNVIVTIPNKANSADLNNPKFSFAGGTIVYTATEDLGNKKTKVVGVKGEDLIGYSNIPIADANSYVQANPQYKVRITGDGVASVYKPLEGAIFELYKTAGGVKVEPANPIPINGNTEIRSNADGVLDFGNYAFAFDQEYGVFEKTAPSGYERLIQPRVFKIKDESARQDFNGTYSFHINNKKLDNSILVSKYDSITRRVLGGAIFGLYHGHAPITAASVPIKQITTGDDGFAYFDELEVGDYTVREIQAPDGYREPYTNTRDRQITITPTNKRHSYLAYNTKVQDIKITKKWMFGSEKVARVVLMRRAVNEAAFTPVTANVVYKSGEAGSTAVDGSVDLTLERGLEVVYKDLPQANPEGRAYVYEVKEISVLDAAGNAFPVVNSQIDARYGVMIAGNPSNGYEIQNVAVNPNRRNITVSKNWTFADGSTQALEGSKIVVALMQQIGSAAPTEFRRVTLDASNNWRHTFPLLVKRINGEEVTYFVKEVNQLQGFRQTITEDMAQQTPNTNVFVIDNKAIKRDRIEITKTWDGVNPSEAPEIFFDLYDSQNMTTPMFSKPVTLQGGVYKAVFEDVPSFAYTVVPNAGLPDLNPDKGKIEARTIKYVVKERYHDGVARPAYTFTTNLNDEAFASYSTDANIKNNLSFTAANTMAKQDVKIVKTWEGVNAGDAPPVVVQLFDITDDTTTDHSDTASHRQVGTNRTLQYSTDASQNFTTVFASLPKYRPDGITEIKYMVRQVTTLAGYDTTVNAVATVDAQNKLGRIHSRRKTKTLQFRKEWEMSAENYPGANLTKPDVYVDILADTSEDAVVNPAAYMQDGIQTANLLLNAGNGFSMTIANLNAYTNDGQTKIKYYLKERDLTGYLEPVDPTGTGVDGQGRIALAEDAASFYGTLVNKQEKVDLYTELHWEGLEHFTPAALASLPAPTLEVWDKTDPAAPKRVRANVPMVLVEDTTTPNRARWTAQMSDLPKYRADGTNAIVYEVVQVNPFTGYTTKSRTIPVDANGQEIHIRDASGNLLTDAGLRNQRLANASFWQANVTNTVKRLDVTVQKTWEGRVEESATIHLLADGHRVQLGGLGAAPVAHPTQVNHTPASVMLMEHNPGQSGTWNYTFRNLPYTKIDGTSVIHYDLEEEDITNFSHRIIRTEVDVPGRDVKNLRLDLYNTFTSIDITVRKVWEDADRSHVPQVHLQLRDVTDITHPIPIYGMTAVLDHSNQFEAVLENVPKFKDDGVTRIRYDVTELDDLPGYRLTTDTSYSDTPTPTSEFGTATITATNKRVPTKLRMRKVWEDEMDGSRPDVEFLLYKDETNDGLENPVPVTQIGGQNLELKLTPANGYEREIELPKYASDGRFEIRYYIKEVPLAGYRASVADTLLMTSEPFADSSGSGGAGSAGSSSGTSAGSTDILYGEIRNKIVPIDVTIHAVWQNMHVYRETGELPLLHVSLYDVSDPLHPRKVSEEASLIRGADGKDHVVFLNQPKFKADGVTPIQYGVLSTEIEDGSLPGYLGSYDDPVVSGDGNVQIDLKLKPRMRKITITKQAKKGQNTDVESNLMFQGKNYLQRSLHINGGTGTETIEVPYFEPDGMTQRHYTLYSYEPEGFLLDVDFHAVPREGEPSRFTDMLFELNLKKGKRPNRGGSGEIKGGASNRLSTEPKTTDPLSTRTDTDISDPTSTDRVIQWSDPHGKTVTTTEQEIKRYTVDKTGRIVPKTSDDGLKTFPVVLPGSVLLAIYIVLERKRKKQ